jgi:hypothetical protein
VDKILVILLLFHILYYFLQLLLNNILTLPGWVRKRYFVLKHRTLFYYKSPEQLAPTGIIPLDPQSCSIEIGTLVDESEKASEPISPTSPVDMFPENSSHSISKPQHVFDVCRFALHTPKGVYWLRARNTGEYEQWVRALANICPVFSDALTPTEQVVKQILSQVLDVRNDPDLEQPETMVYLDAMVDRYVSILAYTEKPEAVPVTTLSSIRFREEAQKIFNGTFPL